MGRGHTEHGGEVWNGPVAFQLQSRRMLRADVPRIDLLWSHQPTASPSSSSSSSSSSSVSQSVSQRITQAGAHSSQNAWRGEGKNRTFTLEVEHRTPLVHNINRPQTPALWMIFSSSAQTLSSKASVLKPLLSSTTNYQNFLPSRCIPPPLSTSSCLPPRHLLLPPPKRPTPRPCRRLPRASVTLATLPAATVCTMRRMRV